MVSLLVESAEKEDAGKEPPSEAGEKARPDHCFQSFLPATAVFFLKLIKEHVEQHKLQTANTVPVAPTLCFPFFNELFVPQRIFLLCHSCFIYLKTLSESLCPKPSRNPGRLKQPPSPVFLDPPESSRRSEGQDVSLQKPC